MSINAKLSILTQKVYSLTKQIPKGKVIAYKGIAKELGNPKLARVVGNILNKNKDPKVPCHRIIRSDGRIGGYNQGCGKKLLLLKKEGVKIKNRKVDQSFFFNK